MQLSICLLMSFASSLTDAFAQQQQETIVLRGNLGEIVGQIIMIDDAGVQIRIESGREPGRLYLWDQVRDIRSDSPRPEMLNYLSIADKLWRARTRLQRGDMALAEPLFAELFPKYRGQTNETALIVAEGLLRCRLAHGQNDLAVIPALECIRLRRAGVKSDRYSESNSSIFDENTQLCMQLAPEWLPNRSLVSAKIQLELYESPTDEVVAVLALQYLTAMRRTLGESIEAPPRGKDSNHPGITLLNDLLATSDSSIETRLRNIDLWRQRLAHEAVALWVQPWVRFAVGRSMLQSTNPRTRQEGVVQLLYVPVRNMNSQPYLAGLSLLLAEKQLRSTGDISGAERLNAELRTMLPNHPILREHGSTHAVQSDVDRALKGQ